MLLLQSKIDRNRKVKLEGTLLEDNIGSRVDQQTLLMIYKQSKGFLYH